VTVGHFSRLSGGVMTKYDEAYRILYSTREFMEEFLRHCVQEPFIEELDFSSLVRVNGSYVSDSLDRREEDMVWRIDFRGRAIYLYVLLEFQSREDDWMALRMMTYLGLFYQDLQRQNLLVDGLLPPVLPVVLYTGEGAWRPATDIRELIACPGSGLERYSPRLSYLLVDVNAPPQTVEQSELLSAIFALENSKDPAHTGEVIAALALWLKKDVRDEVKRTVALWLMEVLKLPQEAEASLNEALEEPSMIQQKMERWTKEIYSRGRTEGREEGREEGKLQIAVSLKSRGMDPAEIADITGLSIEDIEQL